ncbi:MAG TPA: tautomerase family protein [Rhodocyclaceae bacterium]|nr:tautomerase family protein [Rhodocyclaceae bacterium]HMZ84091.1 tautomerase family protein [Rhodocyclaceae bacterium]HNA04820.1 tautomerase family protein [Rhodocyclaceae bacterium]HNB79962.1 tautomerase family protein [Rhodocyclaceae bacterium]HNI00070.1 tautomerase family protein [Rhodocyclaceae bacterium]
MPIVNFHLVEGMTTSDQNERLLVGACRLYADVLGAPVDRIRAFITTHSPDQFAAGGDLACNNGVHAPFFDFIVLEGRPLEHRQRLHVGFTDLIVDVLGVPRAVVRGGCRRVDPEDWSIGGTLASEARAAEIRARAEAAAQAAQSKPA